MQFLLIVNINSPMLEKNSEICLHKSMYLYCTFRLRRYPKGYDNFPDQKLWTEVMGANISSFQQFFSCDFCFCWNGVSTASWRLDRQVIPSKTRPQNPQLNPNSPIRPTGLGSVPPGSSEHRPGTGINPVDIVHLTVIIKSLSFTLASFTRQFPQLKLL